MLPFLFAPLNVLLSGKAPWGGHSIPIATWVRRLWAKIILKAHGVTLKVEGPGLVAIQSGQPAIVAANHQSALDIFVCIATLPNNVFFFAKKELLLIPIFGWAAWLAGMIYVDRKKGMNDGFSNSNIQKLLSNGNLLLVYPEGTRSRDGNLLPFKRGAFVMAIDCHVPVISMSIQGTSRLMPKGRMAIDPGEVNVWFGEARETKSLSRDDRFRLSDDIRTAIASRL